MIDKDAIKKEITIDKIEYLLEYYGGEPSVMKPGVLVSRTIDHNPAHEGSRKLYYYDNEEGGLFRSYTGDATGAFDVFELVTKIYEIQFNKELDLPSAVKTTCLLLGISIPDSDEPNFDELLQLDDFTILKKYDKINNVEYQRKKLEYKIYEDKILNNLPQPRILMWEDEGISADTMKLANIRYNPKSCAIVIPYYNEDGNLIGIRERTLIKENEELYGKYRPAYINGMMYNHPLGLCVYGLNAAKENIKTLKKVVIFESEKSVLMYRSYFGEENNIAVAVCGSALSIQQVQLIMKYEPEEIIIAFDRDYITKGDDTFKKQVKNLKEIHKKYGTIANITFMWDKDNLLEPHDSPIDKGIETFVELFKERIQL